MHHFYMSFLTFFYVNKRLINLVSQSKKYVFLTVLLKILALPSNFLLIFSVAQIIKCKGKNIELPVIFITLSVILTILCIQLSSITSFASSKEVKKTLRSLIYEKLLRLGPEYQEKQKLQKSFNGQLKALNRLKCGSVSTCLNFFTA